jgi:uncharacterized protein (UPF0212 family)
MPAQISLFEPEPAAKPARTIYEEMMEFLDHWHDPCPACGRKTNGMWSGYALAIWRIYLCMDCFNRFYDEKETATCETGSKSTQQ